MDKDDFRIASVRQIVNRAGMRVSFMYGLKEYTLNQMASIREQIPGTAIRILKMSRAAGFRLKAANRLPGAPNVLETRASS
jgi:hypothetical protein